MAVNLIPIHTSTPLRTRKGTVRVYDESYKGPLIEPARTNLLNYSEQINLWTVSRATVSPDAVTVHNGAVVMDLLLETVDAATHRAYSLIISKASGAVLSVSVYCKKYNRNYCAFRYGENGETDTVTVVFNFDTQEALLLYGGALPRDGVVSVKALADGVYRVTLTNTSYNTTHGVVYLMGANDAGSVAYAGDVLKGSYFYGVQAEVSPFPTSYIPTAATTVTRPAANLTRPTAGTALESGNNFAIYGRVIPEAGGQAGYLASTFVSASDWIGVYPADNGTNIRLGKVVAGSAKIVNSDGGYAHAANTPFEYLAYQHSIHGMGIAVRSWNGSVWSAWSTWATNPDTQDAPIASTYQIGARNNSNHFAANYPSIEILDIPQNVDPKVWLFDQIESNVINKQSIGSKFSDSTRKWEIKGEYKPFKGVLIEPVRTNKCACRKANPVDTTNITKSGDAAATLTVVDDTAALAAAGLSSICTSGKVYKLDNGGGSSLAYAYISGTTGNTNAHSFNVVARVSTGTGIARLQNTGTGAITFTNTAYLVQAANNLIPANSSDLLTLRAEAGAVVYFILPQLEEGAFCTSTIALDSSGNDPLASITRQGTRCIGQSEGILRPNNIALMGEVIPGASGQNAVILSSSVNSQNFFSISSITGSSVFFYKVIDGAQIAFGRPFTLVANMPFQYQAYQSSVYGMGIRVRSRTSTRWSTWSAWATNADTQDMPIAPTFEIGSRNGVNQFAGNYQLFRTVWDKDPKAYLESLD